MWVYRYGDEGIHELVCEVSNMEIIYTCLMFHYYYWVSSSKHMHLYLPFLASAALSFLQPRSSGTQLISGNSRTDAASTCLNSGTVLLQ